MSETMSIAPHNERLSYTEISTLDFTSAFGESSDFKKQIEEARRKILEILEASPLKDTQISTTYNKEVQEIDYDILECNSIFANEILEALNKLITVYQKIYTVSQTVITSELIGYTMNLLMIYMKLVKNKKWTGYKDIQEKGKSSIKAALQSMK